MHRLSKEADEQPDGWSSEETESRLFKEADELPDRSFGSVHVKTILQALFFIVLWFTTSLFLSLYNTYLFGKTHYNFQYPLFTTTLHCCIQFILSLIV
jgi:hypothetical protein